jgi:IclR family pca regulon transcriptional regulator
VRRCLLTLNALGYIEANGKYFRLTPQVLTLSQAYFSSSPLPYVAQPHIERVSESVSESCSISVLTGDEIVYVARSSRKRQASIHREVGVNLPAYCTSMGRVLLANLAPEDLDIYFSRVELKKFNHKTINDEATLRKLLAQVRKDDFCVIDGELEPDLRAIAIPVRDSTGQVVAAMNVSNGVNRMTSRQLENQVLPVMRQAAAKIRNALVG